MKKIMICTILTTMLLSISGCQNEPEVVKNTNDGSVEVLVYPNDVAKNVSTYMTGFNLSYYRDKDDIWENNDIAGYLKDVKSGILRYPGGAETSYYHWKYPGAPGYKDVPMFQKELKFVSEEHFKTTTWDQFSNAN